MAKKQLRPISPSERSRQLVVTFLHENMGVPYEAIGDAIYPKGEPEKTVASVKSADGFAVLGVQGNGDLSPLENHSHCHFYRAAKSAGIAAIGITNGESIEFLILDDLTGKYKVTEKMFSYKDLCAMHGKMPVNVLNKRKRTDFSISDPSDIVNLAEGYDISGDNTEAKFLPFIINLHECLIDDVIRCEGLKVPGCDYIMDAGEAVAVFNNAGIKSSGDKYRSLLFKDGSGDVIAASIGVLAIERSGHHFKRTYLCVGIDSSEAHHSSLQLAIDDNVTFNWSDQAIVKHDGKIAVGKTGHVKPSDLLQYVRKKSSRLVYENEIYLGRIDISQPLDINSEDMLEFLSRLIEYALIRDSFRAIIKAERESK
ncbi:MAG: hypothetical protein LBU32_19395 [Clostridiales bacterium]|nr:hypothetical protein [Clostridiales bacterium]